MSCEDKWPCGHPKPGHVPGCWYCAESRLLEQYMGRAPMRLETDGVFYDPRRERVVYEMGKPVALVPARYSRIEGIVEEPGESPSRAELYVLLFLAWLITGLLAAWA